MLMRKAWSLSKPHAFNIIVGCRYLINAKPVITEIIATTISNSNTEKPAAVRGPFCVSGAFICLKSAAALIEGKLTVHSTRSTSQGLIASASLCRLLSLRRYPPRLPLYVIK